MIDLYYWTTPNGHKITIFLEEAGLAYKIVPVNISQGDQFKPEFLAISPNNRIPAIVDHEPKDGGKPIPVFESGAILLYLAEKTGKFMHSDFRRKVEVTQWLFWQMGGLGPMAGQNHHFSQYAPKKIPYAIDRYVKETNRLYGVLDKRLADREFIAGEYSIADMATYPWIVPYERQGQKLEDFPHLKRWFESIKARAAVVRAYDKAKESTRSRLSRRNPSGSFSARPRPARHENKRLGATLETVTADRETNVLAFRKTLEPIRTVLAAQPYVGGGAPAYADYAVFGCFQWARCTSSFPLLLKDDPVWAWRDRLLFAFDGFAAQIAWLCGVTRTPRGRAGCWVEGVESTTRSRDINQINKGMREHDDQGVGF